MDKVKQYILEEKILNEEERLIHKKVSSSTNHTYIEFRSAGNIKYCIKEHDNQKNNVYADIIQIESTKKYEYSEIILEAIMNRNRVEPIGIFLFDTSEKSEGVIFRSVHHCQQNQYSTLVQHILESEHGHFGAFNRFEDELKKFNNL